MITQAQLAGPTGPGQYDDDDEVEFLGHRDFDYSLHGQSIPLIQSWI